MAIYYIDYNNGADSGSNSTTTPWKTLKYTLSQITVASGDEIRIHAGAEPTLINSACTQTATYTSANSFLINTPTDLRASLAVNDFIYIGNIDYAFKIGAITASQITVLNTNVDSYARPVRFSADGTTTFSVWKAGGVVLNFTATGNLEAACFVTPTGLTPYSDQLIISGGWADGFTTKTALGRTVFHRGGSSAPTDGTTTNYTLWQQTINGSTDGMLFKDFGFTNVKMMAGTNTLSNFNLNLDSIWMAAANAASNALRVTENSRLGATNLANHYNKNFNLLFAVNQTQNVFMWQNAPEDTTAEWVYDFTGYTITYNFYNAAGTGTPGIYFTGNGGTGLAPNMSGFKVINNYNPVFCGVTGIQTYYVPAAVPIILRPTPTIAGQGSITASTYPDGGFFLFDNIILEGYPVTTLPRDVVGASSAAILVKLSADNLTNILSTYNMCAGRGYYSNIKIEAPIDPTDLTVNGAWSPDEDTLSLYNTDNYPNTWTNTANGKVYYFAGQNIVEIDTIDFSTGTNAFKMRPGAIGSSGSVYGGNIRVADFRMRADQTATVTLRLKRSGTGYGATTPMYLTYLASMQTLTNSIQRPLSQVGGIQQTANVTDTWADYTFTITWPFSPMTTQPNYRPMFNLYVGDGGGAGGSEYANAGRYMHIDSVTVTIS